jgi:hypothetical protein
LYSSTARTTQPAEVTASTLAAAAASCHGLSVLPYALADRAPGLAVDEVENAAAGLGLGQPRNGCVPEYLDCIVNPRWLHVHPGQPDAGVSAHRPFPLEHRDRVPLDAKRPGDPTHRLVPPGREDVLSDP